MILQSKKAKIIMNTLPPNLFQLRHYATNIIQSTTLVKAKSNISLFTIWILYLQVGLRIWTPFSHCHPPSKTLAGTFYICLQKQTKTPQRHVRVSKFPSLKYWSTPPVGLATGRLFVVLRRPPLLSNMASCNLDESLLPTTEYKLPLMHYVNQIYTRVYLLSGFAR